MGEFVTLEVDEETQVATMRLDRPPMNALSKQVWQEIAESSREAALRDDVGAVVVWGGDKIFAAGADIKEFPNWDYHEVKQVGQILHRSLLELEQLPKVTIAAVNGLALGGGCELAMACDFRFSGESAKFGQPEILLGLIPGAGGTQRLPRLVGVSRAKELVYSGRQIAADEAASWGLVDRVVPDDEVFEAAREQAAQYASGPYALRLAKHAINDGMEMELEHGLRLESALFAECFVTEDATIGIESFMENGPGSAEFTGR